MLLFIVRNGSSSLIIATDGGLKQDAGSVLCIVLSASRANTRRRLHSSEKARLGARLEVYKKAKPAFFSQALPLRYKKEHMPQSFSVPTPGFIRRPFSGAAETLVQKVQNQPDRFVLVKQIVPMRSAGKAVKPCVGPFFRKQRVPRFRSAQSAPRRPHRMQNQKRRRVFET
jgi:hypothetical protein